MQKNESDLTSADQVVEYITSNILTGRMVPGQRLVEADLTQALGLSRGPVREAYRRLDALGIISPTMHRGVCIRALSRDEMTDLLVAVEPLAGLIAQLAAAAVASQLEKKGSAAAIERELRPYRDREEYPDDLLGHRRHFYDVLMAVGGNSQLPSVLPTMRIHLLRLQIQPFLQVENRRRHLEDYERVTKAVLGGDAKQASKLMCQHIQRMGQAIGKLPDEAFPRSTD
jgi:DNA-binding GntR family transcriptional regulator